MSYIADYKGGAITYAEYKHFAAIEDMRDRLRLEQLENELDRLEHDELTNDEEYEGRLNDGSL